jgi:hypothetical protein
VFEHVAVSHLVCFCAAATMASVWFCLRRTVLKTTPLTRPCASPKIGI